MLKKIRVLSALIGSIGFAFGGFACDHEFGDHDCYECRAAIGPSIYGSTGKWRDHITPKRGWVCQEVEDLGTPSEECEMCEKETLRYVHQMSHPNYDRHLRVGCICAGHMEGDLAGAKARETKYKNYFHRRENWLDLKWHTSKKGNPYLKKDKHLITIVTTKNPRLPYSASIDRNFLPNSYKTSNEAKMAVFEHLYSPH